MNTSAFNTLITGLLCLAVSGLGAGLHNQHQRVTELQSRLSEQLPQLQALRADTNALQDAQEQLRHELRELRLTVDSGEQQATTLDPLLEQWAQEIQALRDGLAVRASAAELTALNARLEQAERQLVGLATKPTTPPSPVTAKPKQAIRHQPPAPSPPFSLLGVESRGGVRFLLLAPTGSRSLADARLLHRGEQIGAWRLQALEAATALFSVAGQPDQRLPIPRGLP
jgi:hypothetical protein